MAMNETKKDTPKIIIHPAWFEFLKLYTPASKQNQPEYYTLSQILELINGIMPNDLEETQLYFLLKENGFEMSLPPINGLCLWMLKPVL